MATSSSAIHVLPLEILTLIFTLSLPGNTIAIPHITCDAPWSLGQVCRAWRQLTLTTPTLWENISVCTYNSDSKSHHLKLKECFARSATAPLSVSITTEQVCSRHAEDIDSKGITSEREKTLQATEKMVLSSARRWKELSCSVACAYYFPPAQHGFPLLRRLSIVGFFNGDADDRTGSPPSAFKLAPCLTRLTLHIDVLDGFPELPFAQLTHLKLYGAVTDRLLNCLRKMKNLEELDMRYADVSTNRCMWSGQRQKRIRLENLRVLLVLYENAVSDECLLAALVVPKVQYLNLYAPCADRWRRHTLDILSANMRRCSSSVKRVSLFGLFTRYVPQVACELVLDISRLVPGVAELDFPEDPVEDMDFLMDAMKAARRDDPTLLPNLQRCTLRDGVVRRF